MTPSAQKHATEATSFSPIDFSRGRLGRPMIVPSCLVIVVPSTLSSVDLSDVTPNVVIGGRI